MLTVGYIEDEKSFFEDYQIKLKRCGIELILAENCTSKEDVLKWIIANNLKCIIADYKLENLYSFRGTNLVAYINSELPDLPCIILSNYCEEGIDNNLVIKNMFVNREVMAKLTSDKEFEDFISTIKQAIEVFNNRLKLHMQDFGMLKLKKDNGTISAIEEERFLSLYRLLRTYNEVDDIPVDLLKSDTGKKLDDILKALDKMIEKTE